AFQQRIGRGHVEVLEAEAGDVCFVQPAQSEDSRRLRPLRMPRARPLCPLFAVCAVSKTPMAGIDPATKTKPWDAGVTDCQALGSRSRSFQRTKTARPARRLPELRFST